MLGVRNDLRIDRAKLVAGAAMGVLAMAAMTSSAARAAEASDAAVTASGEVSEIVVTATRVAREGFTAPTPVTALSGAELLAKAPTTLGDALNQIPSFRPTNTPATSGVNSRNGGIVSADLRGLGAQRTLVLVDGRRFVPSTAEGIVDLKLIPTLLVDQVEVVTGGASAAWGSDAVAGVVNFHLKDRFEGFASTVQAGLSERGDNEEWKAGFAAGGQYMDGKLHVVLGGDYLDNRGIGSQYTRDWGRKGVGLITNPAFAANGLPNFIISPNVHLSVATPGTLVVSGPLRGTAFGPGGVPYQFNFGQVFGASMIGGTVDGLNPTLATDLAPVEESFTGITHIDYELAPHANVFAEFSTGWADTHGRSQQPRDLGTLTIQRDNAYLPAATRALMVADGLTSLKVGRIGDDTGRIGVDGMNQTYRGVVGGKGALVDGWTWDAYYQYGRNRYYLDTGPNNRIAANWTRAVDAVVGPTGQIVCRSTLSAPTNGCIPVDIFGSGAVSASNRYVFGNAWFQLITQEQVASFNVKGDAYHTWAGPISVAAGAEYRDEKADATSDPLSQQVQANTSVGAFSIGNQLPLHGEYHLWEGYAETVVPLAKDQVWARNLDLNAAVRHTDYSTSGPVTTWKVGLSWTPIDDIRLRATRSRDIRAPNLSELFQAGGSSFTNVFDPVLNQTVLIRQVAQPNPDLKPETADTTTAGVILRPHLIPGLDLSIDYYEIKINGVIGTLSPPIITSGCFAGNAALCSQIVFNPDHSINFVLAENQNFALLKTSGVDMEASYRIAGADLPGNLPGHFNLHLLTTYVAELTQVNPSGVTKVAGQLSGFSRLNGVPHWMGTFQAGYDEERWGAMLQARYIGSGVYSNLLTQGAGAANTINDNSIPAYVYLDLFANYNLKVRGHDVTLYTAINNLLDKDPPLIPSGAAGFTLESSTNTAFYDVVGRNYKFGLRFKF